ncbi:MAG TPA: hypothetical protein VJ947_07630 [Pseudohaliea sp.]|nr:hypothetical protein [Pseudohaliea sp.]
MPRRDCLKVVDQLRHYSEFHFREEETLMRERRLHPEAIASQEWAFFDEAARLERELPVMAEEEARRLHDYVVHWPGYHILGIDQSMARQLAALADGADPLERGCGQPDGVHGRAEGSA